MCHVNIYQHPCGHARYAFKADTSGCRYARRNGISCPYDSCPTKYVVRELDCTACCMRKLNEIRTLVPVVDLFTAYYARLKGSENKEQEEVDLNADETAEHVEEGEEEQDGEIWVEDENEDDGEEDDDDDEEEEQQELGDDRQEENDQQAELEEEQEEEVEDDTGEHQGKGKDDKKNDDSSSDGFIDPNDDDSSDSEYEHLKSLLAYRSKLQNSQNPPQELFDRKRKASYTTDFPHKKHKFLLLR